MGDQSYHRFFYESRRTSNEVDGGRGSGEINAISEWFGKLSGSEALCWAFGICPSELETLIWRVTENDLRTKLKVAYGFVQAKSTQEFQGMAFVVSKAFGGGAPKEKPPETAEQAIANFKGVFG